MNVMPLEQDTRRVIDRNLENLGWVLDEKNNGRNVFFEQPRTSAEKKKLQGKKPDYVLYSKNSDSPLAVIEAKRKGERLDVALEQGINYARTLNAPLVFATDGVFCKSFHTLGNTTPRLNGEDVDEFLREALALRFLNDWEVDTVSQKVKYSRQELIKIFDEANNMLRGDGLRAGIERFGEFANILFLKLLSEDEQIRLDSGSKPTFATSCSWDTIKNMSPAGRIDYINSHVFKKLNERYDTVIFTPLTMKDNVILKEIMDKLDPLSLTDVNSDVKGDAFEYFLRASASTKNDLGEYFTPRHIVKTMIRLVDPQIGEKIYDPFCGTGGFLIETFRYIHDKMARTDKNRKDLKESTVYGNEITNTARITKMNMILAGDGHSNINTIDSLANPVNGEYDVVITNMPYSQKTRYGDLYDVPSNNGDSICVQHCIQAVNAASENGRIALVVPEGFLFRKDLTKAREYLLERCQLQSIISLPQGVFLPYTGVKTNILYAKKVNQKLKSSEKRKDFWYFDVKNDGYSLDNHRRKVDKPSDLSTFEEFRKMDGDQEEEMIKVGFDIIPLDKVRENSSILVGGRYKKTIEIYSNNKSSFAKLRDVCEFKYGKALKKEDRINGFYPVYGSSGIVGFHNEYLVKAPFIVIGRKGTAGKVSYSDVDGYPIDTTFYVDRVKNIVLMKYLSLTMEHFCFKNISIQTGVPGLSRDDAYQEIIPLPPIEVQQQIVDEIEGYQRIIDGARQIVENYKPLIIYADGWTRVKLGDVCEFAGGTQPPKSTFKFNNEVGYIRLLQIRDYKNDDYMTYIPVSERHKTCSEDDVMIGRYGPPVFQILRGKSGAYNVALIKCIPDETKITKEWLYYFLDSTPVQDYIIGLSMRGRQAGVSPSDLKDLDLPLPSLEVQRKMVLELVTEETLIQSSRQLIDRFTKKINDKISGIWGE